MGFMDNETPDLPDARSDLTGRFLPVAADKQVPASWLNKLRTALSDIHAWGRGVRSGAGSPEGVVTAAVGTLYRRTDGGAGTTLYVKESGAAATGWVAK